MLNVLQDTRFALRTLRKTPAFTLLAIVTIALGIGANTAVFSMVNGVLLRRLPYAADRRLVALHQPSATFPDARFSTPEVTDYRSQVPELAAVAEYHSMSFQLFGRGDPQRVLTGVVSDNFFGLLGVRPLLGRLFVRGEEAVGAAPVVVLSYRYWMNTLGGDPKIVGATFTMNDRIHTVVGVLPPLPSYPDDNDIWMPAGACPFRSAPAAMSNRRARLLRIFAVLKDGVSFDRASRSIGVVAARLRAEYPEAYPAARKLTIAAAPLRDELTQSSRPLFLMLFATAAFVLLIAAANFASLTLSRQLRRGREMALRSALGATRARLFRQLVTESLCVTLVGGALGIAIAYSGLGLLRTLAGRVTPRAGEIAIDPTVLGFALLLSVVVGIVSALVPLRRAVDGLATPLRAGAIATTGGQHDGRTRGLLVGAQVAVAFIVLIAAGLLTRSLVALQRVDGGYQVDHVATARVSLDWTRYTNRPQFQVFADALINRLASEPGISTVALASDFPLNNAQPSSQPFQLRGQSLAAGDPGPTSDVTIVGPGYFTAMGIPILRGRTFTPADRDTANRPAVISQRLATTYWSGKDPLGQQLSIDNGQHYSTVIGVVADVRQNRLDAAGTDEIYIPYAVTPTGDIRVLVRSQGDPFSIGARIRAAVKEIDPNQAVVDLQTLDQLRGARLAEPRETAILVLSFAVLSLIITAGGLAGVVGYSVSQRVTEIGIRVALGASRADVLRTVMRGAAAVVVLGLGFGVAGALALTRLMRGLLYDVTPADPATFGVMALALVAIASIACLLPATRALRVDPIEALRVR